MPKPQKYRDVVKFLRSKGWALVRRGKGSHEVWGSADGSYTLILAPHGAEVSAGQVKQVIAAFPDAPRIWR
ncbi:MULTISPECIES: type II toxin-antitoxin system HicA family toxin [Bacillati]|uniref:Type II toxin-antitoxin system HicA family toxin n=1 Tax=Rathayibacter rathayi TaxID=33887 RepID=A0ABD6W4I8_RATRA|nr:type II toxin-antitoxin system HicA family toxin [Rathayibacter rathayi]MWV76112.1 addiction module toxin, HicA family [Rathayibacter rathayi NCPPB 2980 = VKM Ac-1601]PPF09421.1 type II toxin-antitoxin system HicA family toxin [Rathayibacter rathayi]PPF45168.1 type II toxin-antitoxin system HicA family toxin [Rathayibacter rathayi]PPF77721.1 type II toxin-antitoxin system HicA family toxin [Rathayibacter rathayi]PPG11547.1 type II toxin-antitoxin system HicA family toxin [Rathayibacter rath